MQVGFNCLLSHKGIMLLMLPLTCKGLAGFSSLLLMYINTLWLEQYIVMFLRYINTLWLGGIQYVGKFWSGKKLANLANRRPFANFLSTNVSAIHVAHSPIFYPPIDSDQRIRQCFTPPNFPTYDMLGIPHGIC